MCLQGQYDRIKICLKCKVGFEEIMVKEGLSIRLQKAREACGLSPRDVAEALHVTQQAVSQWEKGKSFPDVGNLVKLSDLYGMSLDWLLKGEKTQGAEEIIEEKVTEVLDKSAEEDKVSEIEKKIRDKTFQEILGILLILVLSCHLPFVGILVSIVIGVWIRKTERKYRWMYVICIFVCIVSTYNTCIVCDHLFDWGISTIEQISSLKAS